MVSAQALCLGPEARKILAVGECGFKGITPSHQASPPESPLSYKLSSRATLMSSVPS